MAAVLQLVSFVADFGMTPEAAAHQPRIDVSGPDKVTADRRLAPDILRALQADGATEIVEHGVLPINFACPSLLTAARAARVSASAMPPRHGLRQWRRPNRRVEEVGWTVALGAGWSRKQSSPRAYRRQQEREPCRQAVS